jgi:hypothetical protein
MSDISYETNLIDILMTKIKKGFITFSISLFI